MSKGLTQRQQTLLDFIIKHQMDRGFAPTVREMQKHLGDTNHTSVEGCLGALVRKGFIKRGFRTPRGITVVNSPMGNYRMVPLLTPTGIREMMEARRK